jgi:hypothetical protein
MVTKTSINKILGVRNMVPMTLVKEFQPITHQYNNYNQSQTIRKKNPYLTLIAMMTNDMKEKMSLKLQTFILKKQHMLLGTQVVKLIMKIDDVIVLML